MQPILILSPLLGTPRTQGLHSISAHLWAPEKAGVRQPILILSPLLGPGGAMPLNKSTTYHAPPPRCNIFCPYICTSK